MLENPENIKLALVTHWVSKAGGGVSAVVEDLSRALILAEAEASVYGLQDLSWDIDRGDWRGAPCEAYSVVGPKSVGFSPQLRAALRNSNANIAHLHGLWLHTSADVKAWAGKARPFVISPHGMLDSWAIQNSSLKKRFARLLYEDRVLRSANCIHALNAQEADAIRAFGLTNPICIIPNGIALPMIDHKTSAPWAQTFGPQTRVLLFLGRLHPKKNVHGLLNAMSILKSRNELGDWRLVIAGWDQNGYGEKLQAQVASQGLNSDVSFLGPVFGETKKAVLSNASAFILPSFSEGLPMAVLEAWSYGLPVMMSSACNLPIGFESGAAVNIPTAPEAMVGPLKRFLSSQDEYLNEMGGFGRALVEREFSWSSVAASFIEVYNWLLEGGERPTSIDVVRS